MYALVVPAKENLPKFIIQIHCLTHTAAFIEIFSIQHEKKKSRHAKYFSFSRIFDLTFSSRNQLIEHFGVISHKKRIRKINQEENNLGASLQSHITS